MPQITWTIEHYETRNGDVPVAEFLDSLSDEEFKQLDNQVDRLEEHGTGLGRPHVGYLRDKIWELRARRGRVRLRLLFFRAGNRFVLTRGFRKKSDRVRDSELDEAVANRTDYLSKHQEDQ